MGRKRAFFAISLLLVSAWSVTIADSDDAHVQTPRDSEKKQPVRDSPSDHHQQKREPRIVGGLKTGPDKYPYFVRIDNARSGTRGICGGSLVAPDVVLSAGHCFRNSLRVAANGYNRSRRKNKRQRYRRVQGARRHPNYNETTWENDFLLLKLKKRVDIRPIPLNLNATLPSPGDDAIAVGMGRRTEGGNLSFSLRHVTVPVSDPEECVESYRKIGRKVWPRIMLCAGDLDKSPCKGDSGGPLLSTGANKTLLGVISWGAGCGRKNYPTVYARISGVQDWLVNNICNMTDFPPTFCPKRVVAASTPTTAPKPTNVPISTPAIRASPKPTPNLVAPKSPPPTKKPTARPTPRAAANVLQKLQDASVATETTPVPTSPPTPKAAVNTPTTTNASPTPKAVVSPPTKATLPPTTTKQPVGGPFQKISTAIRTTETSQPTPNVVP